MFALLKILLFFILFFIIFVMMMGYSFLRQIKNSFRKQNTRRESHNGASSAHRSTHVDGNIVTDRRSPKDAGKRIISDDEGEYVDYEER